jgi:hypothetical protein
MSEIVQKLILANAINLDSASMAFCNNPPYQSFMVTVELRRGRSFAVHPYHDSLSML